MTIEAALRAAVVRWKSFAEDFNITRGDSEVEGAFHKCINDVEDILAAPAEPLALTKPTYPVGVSVLLTCGDMVLLGERINNTAAGMFSTPGGRIENEEDILTTAVRETYEETGIKLNKESLKVIAWREHKRFGGHYFMFYVHAVVGTEVQAENKEPDKCKAWFWHQYGAVPENCTEPSDILRIVLQPTSPLAKSVARACRDEDLLEGLKMALSICEQYKKREYGPHGTEWVSCEDVEAVAKEIQDEIDAALARTAEGG